MNPLYPLQFNPIPVERIWGGEGWALSGLGGISEAARNSAQQSVVSNGFLAGNEINELIEIYMGDLVGDSVYQKFGCEFPLIVKVLYINDYLSFQVHPSDEVALSRHHAYGKAEAWYILHAAPSASIFLGFDRRMSEQELMTRCLNQTLPEVMNQFVPRSGECFFIPAGTVHAAGGGLVILEIQQVSDITYRIYDWGREFLKESAREMHLELAMDAISWNPLTPPLPLQSSAEMSISLVESPHFHLSKRVITAPVSLSNTFGTSFRLIICTEGEVEVTANKSVNIKKGEVVLIPAAVSQYSISPKIAQSVATEQGKPLPPEVLEVWIPQA